MMLQTFLQLDGVGAAGYAVSDKGIEQVARRAHT